jgi:hypothetical protein
MRDIMIRVCVVAAFLATFAVTHTRSPQALAQAPFCNRWFDGCMSSASGFDEMHNCGATWDVCVFFYGLDP